VPSLQIELIKPGTPALPPFRRWRWTDYAIRLRGPRGEQVIPLLRYAIRRVVVPLHLFVDGKSQPYVRIHSHSGDKIQSACLAPDRLGEMNTQCAGLLRKADRAQIYRLAMAACRKIHRKALMGNYQAERRRWLHPKIATKCFIQRLESRGNGTVRVFLCRIVPDTDFGETLSPSGSFTYQVGDRQSILRDSNRLTPVEVDDLVSSSQDLLTPEGHDALAHFAARAALLGKVTS
jgi:hypothetical protein